MRRVFISSCLIIVFILGCQNGDSTVNPILYPHDIMPLAIGNQWNYNLYLYDSTGAFHLTKIRSFEVIGDTMIDGVRWFNFSDFLCANRDDGLRSLVTSGQLLIFKFPAFPQDSFFVNDVVGYLRITSIDTVITIALGTFHCVAYESRALISEGAYGTHEILYVSPGVGPIRFEVYALPRNSEREYLWTTAELSSVTLR